MSQINSALHSLEQHWQLTLPEAFGRLYRAFEYPYVSPCEFLSLEEMRSNSERWRGMLPQFLPFGHDGAENYYGFYLPALAADHDYPVLAWDHEYDHYYPVASGFEAFVRWCVIYGRYEAQDDYAEDDEGSDEESERRDLADLLGLPASMTMEPLPRNDRELHERLLGSDSQSAFALAQLGSACLGQADHERARNYFTRASEAAPWFADPYYLLAESYLGEDRADNAIERWWLVVQHPIALSTRTSRYDLGHEHPDSEIYEAAADRLTRQGSRVQAEIRGSPLWSILQSDDPFSPGPRLALAQTLHIAGDRNGAERELLNALTLATEPCDTAAAYDRLIAFYQDSGRSRDAALCVRDAQLR